MRVMKTKYVSDSKRLKFSENQRRGDLLRVEKALEKAQDADEFKELSSQVTLTCRNVS